MSDQTDENLSMATVLLVIAVFVAIIASGIVVLVYDFPIEPRPPSLRVARLLNFRPFSEREVWTNKLKAAGRESTRRPRAPQ